MRVQGARDLWDPEQALTCLPPTLLISKTGAAFDGLGFFEVQKTLSRYEPYLSWAFCLNYMETLPADPNTATTHTVKH